MRTATVGLMLADEFYEFAIVPDDGWEMQEEFLLFHDGDATFYLTMRVSGLYRLAFARRQGR